MKILEIDSNKKELASFSLFQHSSCSYFLESYTSRSADNAFDIKTRCV